MLKQIQADYKLSTSLLQAYMVDDEVQYNDVSSTFNC